MHSILFFPPSARRSIRLWPFVEFDRSIEQCFLPENSRTGSIIKFKSFGGISRRTR
ncbi:hypothetical protein QUB05_08665 [Microcoleus sp. F10-C6]|uniref:hypothetical protein n=1 Tax=unclassified Microcoleus TaxID=2642155 RepID=UPI002FD3BB73